MAPLSIILNTGALTASDIEAASKRVKLQKEKLFQYYSKMYPKAYISDYFLYCIRQATAQCGGCNGCSGYPCKKTKNKGFIHRVIEFNGELDVCYERCVYSRIAENFKLAQIPPIFKDKTFNDYEMTAGNSVALHYAQKLVSLFVCGNPGTGKSFLAALMGKKYLAEGKTVLFIDTPSLLDKMRATFNRESEATLEHLTMKLSKVDVLILDDFGTETPTQWAVERLYSIINCRYTNNLPLVVTSNYDLVQIAERLNNPTNGESGVTGTRIVSRIKGMCRVLHIAGTDRRLTR